MIKTKVETFGFLTEKCLSTRIACADPEVSKTQQYEGGRTLLYNTD